jgi:hypothetical protein
MEQLQSHIWLTASSYMGKNLRISLFIRKPFLIYDFATAPLWIPYIWGKFDFLFYQCNAGRLIQRICRVRTGQGVKGLKFGRGLHGLLFSTYSAPSRVFTTFRILEISYISNVFFCFVYHSKMAQISRNYTKFFYANLYKIQRYFEKFCDLLYQFFY